MNYQELKVFMIEKMRMSYQPLMIKRLLGGNDSGTDKEISEILITTLACDLLMLR
jgi:hypothetical protein